MFCYIKLSVETCDYPGGVKHLLMCLYTNVFFCDPGSLSGITQCFFTSAAFLDLFVNLCLCSRLFVRVEICKMSIGDGSLLKIPIAVLLSCGRQLLMTSVSASPLKAIFSAMIVLQTFTNSPQ